MSDKPEIVISHSEVESFLTCQQRHYYAFGDDTFPEKRGLEPTSFSNSLFRGIQGHDALEQYYKHRKDGQSIESAGQIAIKHLQMKAITSTEIMTNPEHLNIVTDLAGRILPRYFENELRGELSQFTPAYVEEVFYLKVEADEFTLVYPFKPDVIMRDAAGNLWVWDHKFIYNFFTSDQINLLPQIPKYIGALRALGYSIKGGYYNQLRWREVKDYDKHISRDRFIPSDARVVNAFRQQYNVMLQIAGLKSSPEEWQEQLTRVLSTMVCKSCSFKYLCAADLNGLDTKLMRRVEFRPNTYGYTVTEDGE